MAHNPGRGCGSCGSEQSPRIERVRADIGRSLASVGTAVPTVGVLVLLVLTVTACAAPLSQTSISPLSPLPAPSATPGPLALTIVHSNDTWGYLDPCG
jgi:hypothetical protein